MPFPCTQSIHSERKAITLFLTLLGVVTFIYLFWLRHTRRIQKREEKAILAAAEARKAREKLLSRAYAEKQLVAPTSVKRRSAPIPPSRRVPSQSPVRPYPKVAERELYATPTPTGYASQSTFIENVAASALGNIIAHEVEELFESRPSQSDDRPFYSGGGGDYGGGGAESSWGDSSPSSDSGSSDSGSSDSSD